MNGTTLCEHIVQNAREVTLCNVWCRHHPAAVKSSEVVCPYAEGACVADHGPAAFLPTHTPAQPPPPAPHPGWELPKVEADAHGEFGRAADAGFANVVRPTYAQRGAEYGDTWATDGLYDEVDRLTDALALVRVKCRRFIGTGGAHRDSVVDLIAYASAYLTWGDESEGWWNGS